MIKLFKGQQPLVFIILPLAILLVWMFSGFQYLTVAADNGMPLYSLVFSLVKNCPTWLITCICFLIIGSQCLHLNWILNRNEVLYKASYLPALFYFLFSSFLPQFVIFHPILFVNSIMLFVLEKILRLYKSTAPHELDFDACLLISVASLFYLPALLYLFLFFISLSILKPFSWRDWVIGFMGFITPYFFLFVILFLNDHADDLIRIFKGTAISDRLEFKNLVPKGYQVTMAVISLLLLMTLIKLRNNFYKNDIKTRNYQQVIIIFIIVSVASAVLTRENMLYKISTVLIPFTVVVSNYFLSIKKNWWAEALLILLLLTTVFNYIISF